MSCIHQFQQKFSTKTKNDGSYWDIHKDISEKEENWFELFQKSKVKGVDYCNVWSVKKFFSKI